MDRKESTIARVYNSYIKKGISTTPEDRHLEKDEFVKWYYKGCEKPDFEPKRRGRKIGESLSIIDKEQAELIPRLLELGMNPHDIAQELKLKIKPLRKWIKEHIINSPL